MGQPKAQRRRGFYRWFLAVFDRWTTYSLKTCELQAEHFFTMLAELRRFYRSNYGPCPNVSKLWLAYQRKAQECREALGRQEAEDFCAGSVGCGPLGPLSPGATC